MRLSIERGSWWLLALTLACALALRLVDLASQPGINGDEAFYGVHALTFFDGASLFQMRTGTELPMNAPFFGVVLILNGLLEPSFVTLRLSAVLHSVLAVGLAAALFRRRGATFVAMLTCLLATLPIQLGFARLAWDATAVPTVSALALAAAVALRPWLTALAFALCLWVHPVTVFALPILASPFVVQLWPKEEDGRLRAPDRRLVTVGLGVAAALLALVVALERANAFPPIVADALRDGLGGQVLARLVDPIKAVGFTHLYLELLSGPTLYRDVAGSMPEGAALLHALAALVVVVTLVVTGVRRLRAGGRSRDLALVAGLALSLALAYLVGGTRVLRPGTERYGMFLVVPSCYVLALLASTLATTDRRAAWLRAGTALLGVAMLVSFGVYELDALRTPDPQRHRTYRTGAVEPKQAAFDQVLRLRDARRTAVVLTEDWWIYWPVRYLAHEERGLRLTIPGKPPDRRFPRDFAPPPFDPRTMEVLAIAWAGSPFDQQIARHAVERRAVGGREPGPILNVYRLRGPGP